MEMIYKFLTENIELINYLTILIAVYSVVFSMYNSRKMFKEKKMAEKLYAVQLAQHKELLRDIEKLELDNKSVREYQNYLIKNYMFFEDALKGLDENTRIQVEPALRQSSVENRKAYLTRMIRIVNSLKSQGTL